MCTVMLQVSAVLKVITAIYLRAFLPESGNRIAISDEEINTPLYSPSTDTEPSPNLPVFRKIPSFSDMANLLTSRSFIY